MHTPGWAAGSAPTRSAPARFFAIQMAAQAALSCASFSVSLLAVALGATDWQIGVIGASYGASQFAASFVFGRAADAYGKKRFVLLGLAASLVAAFAHVLARTPGELVVARLAFGFAAGIFPAALTALAFDENRRLGKFQGFGALGFSLGVLAGGFVGASAHEWVFLLSAALLALAFLLALGIRGPAGEKHVHVPVFPREVVARNAPAYAAMVLRHAGASAAWVVFPIYLVHMGAGFVWLGVVSGVNGAFQFLFMPMADRFKSGHLVVAGLLLSALTFALLALVPNLWWVLAVMPVLAASWAATFMGSLRFCLERSEERATATGLLQSSVQLSAVIGPLMGGAIAFYFHSYRAAMGLGVVLALAALPVFAYELGRHPWVTKERAAEKATGTPPPVAEAVPIPGVAVATRETDG